jgi:hypothetical protein
MTMLSVASSSSDSSDEGRPCEPMPLSAIDARTAMVGQHATSNEKRATNPATDVELESLCMPIKTPPIRNRAESGEAA